MNLYVLKLHSNKYYIGKSANVERRYHDHLSGNGSTWTRKYPPLSIDRIILITSPFDEDKFTKEYMAVHGIDNVRGGSYVTLDLTDEQKKFLKREIWGAQDRCARCGDASHFIRSCPILPESLSPTLTIPNPVFYMKKWMRILLT
jgi:predicted GIY-YIG superfamily endonuclease